jgi:hypothetical protein
VDPGHAGCYDTKMHDAEMMNEAYNINNHLTDINSLIIKNSVICVYSSVLVFRIESSLFLIFYSTAFARIISFLSKSLNLRLYED